MNFEPASPTLRDVLCGTGQERANHPGNDLFKHIASQYIDRYSSATAKKEKMRLTKCILDDLTTAGIRFLKKHPVQQQWYVADQKVARDKIGHFLRDNLRKSPPLPSPMVETSATPMELDLQSCAAVSASAVPRAAAAVEAVASGPPNERRRDSPLSQFLQHHQDSSSFPKKQLMESSSSVWNNHKKAEHYGSQLSRLEHQISAFKVQSNFAIPESTMSSLPRGGARTFHHQQEKEQPFSSNFGGSFSRDAGNTSQDMFATIKKESSSFGLQPAKKRQGFEESKLENGGFQSLQPPNKMIQAGIRASIFQSNNNTPNIAGSSSAIGGERPPAHDSPRLALNRTNYQAAQNDHSRSQYLQAMLRERSSSSSGGSSGASLKGFDLISPIISSMNEDEDYDSDSDCEDDISLFDDTELAQRLD